MPWLSTVMKRSCITVTGSRQPVELDPSGVTRDRADDVPSIGFFDLPCTGRVVEAFKVTSPPKRTDVSVTGVDGQPAVDVSVIMAPVGGAFRTELTAPGPHCAF